LDLARPDEIDARQKEERQQKDEEGNEQSEKAG
jgi:hypothetical protein